MSSELIADYVIVGGGSAGCVLANRLSEDRDVRVILLEAGGTGDSLAVSIPAGTVALMNNPKSDWCYAVEPDPSIGNRRLKWAAGKMLGGGSAINGMVYIRGIRDDYDQWAKMGCYNWSYADVLPHFLRAEHWYGAPSPAHGSNGPLAVSPAREVHQLTRKFIDACVDSGLPYLADYCAGDQFGAFLAVGTQRNGLRCSSAKAYLEPVKGRSNLTIVTAAFARRILFEDRRATGVEVRKGNDLLLVQARREVILSAGTIASPALLLRSGLGSAKQLNALSIPVVADIAAVGRNVQEHPSVRIAKQVNVATYNTLGIGQMLTHLWRYATQHNGVLASIAVQAMAFIKTAPTLAVPDVQINFLPVCMEFPSEGNVDKPPVMAKKPGVMVVPNVCRPWSRGEIRLRSADPDAAPIIDHRLLGDERDVQTLTRAARFVESLFETPSLRPHVVGNHSPDQPLVSDAEWDRYIRRNANISYHPVGSCRMGSDADSVVDTELRVRGVQGLRVVDASVMPTSPSANTNAPTIMIAEKAADMIRGRL